MTRIPRRRLLLAGAALAGLPTSALFAQIVGLRRFNRSGHALGTKVAITLLHHDAAQAEAALDASFAAIERVESVMSLYRPDSQLARLNATGEVRRPHTDLLRVLTHATSLAKQTNGAFDVTVQPLWHLFAEAKRAGHSPDDREIELARAAVDYRRVEIKAERVRLLGDGAAITLNGIAQGYAADAVRAALMDRGVRHAMIDTGEFGVLGHKESEMPWSVGVQHPRHENAYAAVAELDGRALATSGDYATYFSADMKHHHLFDPRTGRSPAELASVSVAAPTAMAADALSTAVFVLGPDAGFDLATRMPNVDALLILKDGRMRRTAGFPIREGV